MHGKFLRHHRSLGYQIFISYRRHDVREITAELVQRELERHFGRVVFLDHTDTQGGLFSSQLRNALEQSQVIVALIGPQWRTAANQLPGEPAPRRRLDREDDWVRQELVRGLAPGSGKVVAP